MAVLVDHDAVHADLIVEVNARPGELQLVVLRTGGDVGLDRRYPIGPADCDSAAELLALGVDRFLSSFPEWAGPARPAETPPPPPPPPRSTGVSLTAATHALLGPLGADLQLGALVTRRRLGGAAMVRATLPQSAGAGRFQQTSFLGGVAWRQPLGGWELRAELNALEGSPKVSGNDLVIRACALALLRHPGVNASFQGNTIRVYHRAHIGIAVALDGGLITPVLRDCDVKPLVQIAAESRDLAERARAGKLRASEISGATFSISNLGMLDVEEFSAIINPPEGAILAVGSVAEKAVVVDGALAVGRRMRMTISCDHRAMDGAMGARFLQDVKRLLEEPLRLLV